MNAIKEAVCVGIEIVRVMKIHCSWRAKNSIEGGPIDIMKRYGTYAALSRKPVNRFAILAPQKQPVDEGRTLNKGGSQRTRGFWQQAQIGRAHV